MLTGQSSDDPVATTGLTKATTVELAIAGVLLVIAYFLYDYFLTPGMNCR